MPAQRNTVHVDLGEDATTRDIWLATAITLFVPVGECEIESPQWRGPADCISPDQWPRGGYEVTVFS